MLKSWIILPEAGWKRIWDGFVLVVTVFAAIEIPLRLTIGYHVEGAILGLDLIVVSIFSLDILFNFFTAEYINGQLVTEKSVIARRYLRGWFLVDLLAALPFDLFVSGFIPTLTYAARTLRLLRLFRLVRLAQFMHRLGQANYMNISVLRMVFLGFWVLLLSHWTACIWMSIGAGNIPVEDQQDPLRFYLRSLYWSITTIVTIGYGDITPQTNVQTIFAMFIEIAGAAMYGYVIGNVASLLANLDVARAQYLEKLEKINTFMRFRKIPETLQERVRSYYEYLWESRRGYDESNVLTDLPGSLKVEVSLVLNKDIIEKVPIFEGANDDLVQQIVMNLRPVVYTPGDYIFRKGEVGDNMFFISRGAVEVVSDDGATVYATLREGNFFGEIALLLNSPRTASIRALDYCDLYTLDKDTFQRILRNFPDFADHVQRLAAARATESPSGAPAGSAAPSAEPQREPPDRVSGCRAVRGEGVVRVEWTPAARSVVYHVVRFEPATHAWHSLNNCVEGPFFHDEQPLPGNLNRYRVRGVNQTGPGEWSEAADA